MYELVVMIVMFILALPGLDYIPQEDLTPEVIRQAIERSLVKQIEAVPEEISTPTPEPQTVPTPRVGCPEPPSSVETPEDAECLIAYNLETLERRRGERSGVANRQYRDLRAYVEADIHRRFVEACNNRQLTHPDLYKANNNRRTFDGFSVSRWSAAGPFMEPYATNTVTWSWRAFPQHWPVEPFTRSHLGFRAFCIEVSGPVRVHLQQVGLFDGVSTPPDIGEPIVLNSGPHVLYALPLSGADVRSTPGNLLPASNYVFGFECVSCKGGEEVEGVVMGVYLEERLPR